MLTPFIIPFVIAIFLAINMGGSGTAPSFSAAFGANIIKHSLIPGMFGIMVFLGAIIGGKETAKTIGKGLLDADMMSFTIVSIILASVALALLLANLCGIPQSTSQATVLAVIAPAIYFHSLNEQKLFVEILPTWFVTPLVSFFLALMAGKFIYQPLRGKVYHRFKIFRSGKVIDALVVIMSMYVAFSIGANNVANATGPLSSMAANELEIASKHSVKILILATLIVAPSFGIGSSVFGNKVLRNTGKEIVLFGKTEAVIIAFVSASILLAASLIRGIPTSLVQLNVAAILGIGVAKLGFRNIFRKTAVNKFFVMWLIAPILAFCFSLLFTYCADCLNLL